ncbi:MAG: 4-(cytidine 5'-diphospho)-2-C-methyl-D-erythritol kinase [Candidatus Latescibacterota bacterium]
MGVQEKAAAKINLGLKILGERTDGYHELLTVMQSLDLCDVVSFEAQESGIQIVCSCADLPEGPDNLVYRAADRLRRKTGCDSGVRIHLEKRIPIGAGLGGGSSDAAATLRGLCRLWDVRLHPDELLEIAASIGSDVPFFLRSGTAIASGRGEILEYVSAPEHVIYVLVYPGFPILTGWAYRNAKMLLTFEGKYINFVTSLKDTRRIPKSFYRMLENDFSQLVEKRHGVVRDIRNRLIALGALGSSLSGSGSTVYGIFDRMDVAEVAAEKMREPGWESFLCRPEDVGDRESAPVPERSAKI